MQNRMIGALTRYLLIPLLLLQLLEETAAEVRPVNLRVAVDTRSRGEMRNPVTLGTNLPDRTEVQKKLVRGPVGHMAHAAPFDLLGQVLIDPGTSFLGVAVEADLVLDRGVRLSEAGPVAGSVGRMAVAAFQSPLKDRVAMGQVEFRLHVPMTGEAEVRIILLQQMLRDPDFMNPVAVRAPHGAQLVDASSELEKGLHLLVTLEADLRPGRRALVLEGKDESFPLGLRMFFPWSMAGFTFLPPVRVFLEGRVDVGMASLACLPPHVPLLLHLPFFLAEGSETDEKYQCDDSDPQDHPRLASTHMGSPLAAESGPFASLFPCLAENRLDPRFRFLSI
jgi:hypothetical protein